MTWTALGALLLTGGVCAAHVPAGAAQVRDVGGVEVGVSAPTPDPMVGPVAGDEELEARRRHQQMEARRLLHDRSRDEARRIAPPQSAPESDEPPNVTGTVYEPDGVTPHAGAWIEATTASSSWYAPADGTGAFALSLPADGEYTLRAHTAWGESRFGRSTGVEVVVDPSGTASPDVVSLQLRPFNVTGTVYEPDGVTPVANADIFAYHAWGDWESAVAASDGTFGLVLDPDRSYDVSASDPDLDGSWAPATAVVTVDAAGTPTPAVLELVLGIYNVTGTVYQPDGTTPVSALASVYAMQMEEPWSYRHSWLSPTGTFRLSLPPGEHQLGVHLYDHTWGPPAPVTVVVGPDGTAAPAVVELVLREINLTGTVHEADGTTPHGGGGHVSAWPVDPDGEPAFTWVAPDGTFGLALQPGEYRVRASTDSSSRSWPFTVSVASDGTATPALVDLILRLPNLTGIVYAPDGTSPLADAFVDVRAVLGDGWGGGLLTGSDGSFGVVLDPETTYQVTAWPPVHSAHRSSLPVEVVVDADGVATPSVLDLVVRGPGPGGPVGDFTGDGRTDRAVWRPESGGWFVAGEPEPVYLGLPGDVAVPADYSGDGITQRAVWRPSTGAWFIEGQAGPRYLGHEGHVPVPGDYDGDGAVEPAVWDPSTGAWFIEGEAEPRYFGHGADVPVPGDHTGDGATDVAVYRPSVGGWYVDGLPAVFHGLPGDVPVPGDYDGDGTVDPAVWRPEVGGWYVLGMLERFVGLDTDVPQPGDFDGDGAVGPAVWRPEVGGWYVEDPGETAYNGLASDVPVILPYAIYRTLQGQAA